MSNVQVGGKFSRNGRNRIERPFAGVIAGLSVNKLRILDLAVERDPHITIRGDVQLVTGVLDRNDLQRMQQVREFIWNFIWIPLNFQLSKYFSHRKPSLFEILSLIKNQNKKKRNQNEI